MNNSGSDTQIEKLSKLCFELQKELEGNILPFWMEKMTDTVHGGFYGQITGNGKRVEDAPKGAILNARILWTFASAYGLFPDPDYLTYATRARDYLIEHFYDREEGGIFWELDYMGQPTQTKKQTYAIAFAIYGLSEYARTVETNREESILYAIRLFDTIEEHCYDPVKNGYMEAFTRDWHPIDDMRLSDKDENEALTMNTHLHILEAYTSLYRTWRDDRLKEKLRNLILIFTDKIMDRHTGHLNLFFNEDWECRHRIISYGHDIEASWLLHEAAHVLGDKEILCKVEPKIIRIAAAAEEGLLANGALMYEYRPDKHEADTESHWWVQAENVVGHINLYQLLNFEKSLDIAILSWEFIKRYLIDHEHGEWHWSVYLDGTVNRKDDKAGFWKCPYHNGRMCMEIIERYKSAE